LELVAADDLDHLVIAPLEVDHHVTTPDPKGQRTIPRPLPHNTKKGDRHRKRT
jgi:hypothetical protein